MPKINTFKQYYKYLISTRRIGGFFATMRYINLHLHVHYVRKQEPVYLAR